MNQKTILIIGALALAVGAYYYFYVYAPAQAASGTVANPGGPVGGTIAIPVVAGVGTNLDLANV
jgi:hypothetical protein